MIRVPLVSRTQNSIQRYDEDIFQSFPHNITACNWSWCVLKHITGLQNQLCLLTVHCCKYMQERVMHESQERGVITGIKM